MRALSLVYSLLLLLSLSEGEVRQCRLMVADTPQAHGRGLMGYRSLTEFDGMVFLYEDRAVRQFWNKNTYLDLDLYWIDGDKLIGRSYLPSYDRAGLVIVFSPGPVDRVVELLKGRKCLYRGLLLSPEFEGSKGNNPK